MGPASLTPLDLWANAEQEIKPITAESENEPGTLQYQVTQGKDDPNEVRIWEEVSSRGLLGFTG